ncbi:MAG: GNAT family N-acetyltransferase [Acetobacteraceae bacterium]|jgi:ribosomal protein S18 acetylase RimI-like enzyme
MIRAAKAADVEAMQSIVNSAYRHYVERIGKPPGPMLDDYVTRIADQQAWVLEDAGEIVGILVLDQGPTELLLDNVAVLPERQAKGFGRALIAFAEAEAHRRGFGELRLYTHALMRENIELYRRIGFVETHRSSEKGYDRVYMTKRL